MSILVVEVVPEGLLFAADRNIRSVNGKTRVIGTATKVFRWPNEKALIGYAGVRGINGMSMEEYLQRFIDEFPAFDSFQDLAEELKRRVEAQRRIDEGGGAPQLLVIHFGGFEEREGVMVPVVWFIRNVHGINEYGDYQDVRREFDCDERFWGYFHGVRSGEIRSLLRVKSENLDPFWFHQGEALAVFNVLQRTLKAAFKQIIEDLRERRLPRDLAEWEKYLRMQVLMFGAYFEAFYPPGEQDVGGGADVVSIPWPSDETC